MGEKTKERHDCWDCAYKRSIPGNAHVSCIRKWEDVSPPRARQTWYYIFPFNFDPTWQDEFCQGWAKEEDPKKVRIVNPLESIISILGGRL